jgi:hypothetical protein
MRIKPEEFVREWTRISANEKACHSREGGNPSVKYSNKYIDKPQSASALFTQGKKRQLSKILYFLHFKNKILNLSRL